MDLKKMTTEELQSKILEINNALTFKRVAFNKEPKDYIKSEILGLEEDVIMLEKEINNRPPEWMP